ncbi:MAG: flagellar FlbD family protein [Clostridiales bacterium]|nr:flagellar FlbD family protein [Clostridiales bacterium]
MIKLTRLDGSKVLMNEDMFELVTETPDTVITLSNGRNYFVKESMDEILELIEAYRRPSFIRRNDRFNK